MALPTNVKLSGLNLNDGTVYTLLPGLDLGERDKSFDAYRSYTGSVAQANVSEGDPVAMSVPLLVQGTTFDLLYAAIGAINTILDSGPTTFTITEGTTVQSFTILHSPRVKWPRTQEVENAFRARIVLTLYRMP